MSEAPSTTHTVRRSVIWSEPEWLALDETIDLGSFHTLSLFTDNFESENVVVICLEQNLSSDVRTCHNIDRFLKGDGRHMLGTTSDFRYFNRSTFLIAVMSLTKFREKLVSAGLRPE